ALTVSTAMQKVTDRFRVSREMLAYVVDSTAAPVCVLLPFSTWAVYVSGLLEKEGLAGEGAGVAAFVQTIPYNLYAIVALALVLLVILGVVPALGPMRRAEQRARETGEVVPPNSEGISLPHEAFEAAVPERPRAMDFLVPVGVLVAATL